MAEALTTTDPDSPDVLPPVAMCRRARLSRDARFDGRFFVGVLTTGIYCRPICPARMPKEENVRYYASAAAAQDAGFRPCLRCRPEAARRLPEWTLGSETVMRALRKIESGYLNTHTTAQLAAQLAVGERQLSRLFAQELGASPKSLARLLRAKTARDILADTAMPMADVAYHAGYGSVSRFNQEIRQIFQCTPGELRGQRADTNPEVCISLPVREPYNFDWVFSYLRKRALTGIELVQGGPGDWCYQRRLSGPSGAPAWLQVEQSGGELRARIPLAEVPLHTVLHRIRRLFDLNADGATLHDFFVDDARLGPLVQQAPGLRVPGAWDGFETAVRAVLGQQVSVARGTELANRMIQAYGAGEFPRADQLVDKQVAELGMPGRRGRAISLLAQQVLQGQLDFDEAQDFDALQNQFEAIVGIGPWTANYVRMRVLKDPDAFPANDWVVLKQLGCTAAAARRQAAAWQPWRAYALMYIWYAAAIHRAEDR